MSDSLAISVQNVGKAYRLWESPSARLTAPLTERLAGVFPPATALARGLRARAAKRYRDFWALKHISFEVRRGEAVGIIGRNGSGKSTLLQIVAGTLQPTDGSVKVNGRIAALLELGSGFNPDFSGRENVFLNAAVLGLTRAETEARFDQIAAFADIGDFLDQPVKVYSSGMMMRLAFAVSVSLQPDILIVDEALSVGDVFFQQKCFKRIHELLAGDTSLLFVSHDTAAVQNLCDRAILLHAGREIFAGPPEEAVIRYYASASARPTAAPPPPGAAPANAAGAAIEALAVAHNILPQARSRHGSRMLEIVAASAQNESGLDRLEIEVGHPIDFTFVVHAHKAVAEPQAGLNLYDRFNTLVFASGNHNIGYSLGAVNLNDVLVFQFRLVLDVVPGEYTASLIVSEESEDGPNQGMFYDVHEGIGPISVYYPLNKLMPFYGLARLPFRFTYVARRSAVGEPQSSPSQ